MVVEIRFCPSVFFSPSVSRGRAILQAPLLVRHLPWPSSSQQACPPLPWLPVLAAYHSVHSRPAGQGRTPRLLRGRPDWGMDKAEETLLAGRTLRRRWPRGPGGRSRASWLHRATNAGAGHVPGDAVLTSPPTRAPRDVLPRPRRRWTASTQP